MKILRDLLTGADNKTHDLGRWSWAASLLSVIALQAWSTAKSGAVDILAYASALGAVSAAHGVAIMAKFKTEPKNTTGDK